MSISTYILLEHIITYRINSSWIPTFRNIFQTLELWSNYRFSNIISYSTLNNNNNNEVIRNEYRLDHLQQHKIYDNHGRENESFYSMHRYSKIKVKYCTENNMKTWNFRVLTSAGRMPSGVMYSGFSNFNYYEHSMHSNWYKSVITLAIITVYTKVILVYENCNHSFCFKSSYT